jgi:FkbM family methyltransferase
MVSMSKRRVKGTRKAYVISRKTYDRAKLGALGVMSLFLVYVLSSVLFADNEDAILKQNAVAAAAVVEINRLGAMKRLNHPDLHVTADQDSESYNAIALEIIQTLKCHKLFNETNKELENENEFNDENKDDRFKPSGSGSGSGSGSAEDDDDKTNDDKKRRQRQRRLDEEGNGGVKEDDDAPQGGDNTSNDKDSNEGGGESMGDDFFGGTGNGDNGGSITGHHLFCLAAFSAADKEIDVLKTKVHCDATHSRQQSLLDLWSAARSEMPEDILMKTLAVAIEQERQLVGTTLHLWAPTEDDGLEYVLGELNTNADEGGITGLNMNLGSSKLFVDVGSCLGLTSMAAALLYPGTKIVSIEAAAPNWLLQEMNWRCNDFTGMDQIKIILSGVGQNRKSDAPQMAKFMWRPHATTSTRAWTPSSERESTDVELTIKLRPWHTLLSQAGISPKQRIDVLNVDCEGCEYNLIPSLSEDAYDAISTVMGGVHWGYIPQHKKPSSQRAKETHERLCRHENFARTAKECCGFPDLAVVSSVPGEVLVQEGDGFPPKAGTVRDVAGDLCVNFDAWAAENHLFDIESDWGWFQISSMAD